MESKPSPARHYAEDSVWSISAGTRQGAQEADACMAADDWLYAAPGPLVPAAARPKGAPSPPPMPSH
ncbi:hypothetical protein ACFP2F_06005 [Hymenobacter artigasi]|uniref:Uncharacterized protein n=1 Tax=Hymenobacter artigasi TaxID=2719616 RepID=A0ABX1HI32_9BACT|nr:hypothetical protein [Hymenobacter artigasi]NKI88418.1 hypothetical protein [Hymenobacter artigasi]